MSDPTDFTPDWHDKKDNPELGQKAYEIGSTSGHAGAVAGYIVAHLLKKVIKASATTKK